MKTYVLYHGGCFDGFGSRVAFQRKLGNTAIYIPVTYGQPIPDMEDGSIVYIVDFSYKRSEMEKLKSRMKKLICLEHHKTAQNELDGLDYVVFDNNKSGCRLAWEYLNPPSTNIPQLLQYVEDRDLWRWALPNSKEINAFISSFPFDIGEWNKLSSMSMMNPMVIENGKTILRFIDSKVEQIITSTLKFEKIANHIVPIVNCPLFMSEVGEKLLVLNPSAEFAGYKFSRPDGKVQYGLRSRSDFDVSEVARAYGGGGHKQASGFELTAEQLEEYGL